MFLGCCVMLEMKFFEEVDDDDDLSDEATVMVVKARQRRGAEMLRSWFDDEVVVRW